LKNSREKEEERESHQYFTIGTRCWSPLSLFVALIIYYDMIGERLILILCGKAISRRLLISFCQSVYLSSNHYHQTILLSFFQELFLVLTVPFIEQTNVY
jgi:hypothetical protein